MANSIKREKKEINEYLVNYIRVRFFISRSSNLVGREAPLGFSDSKKAEF
tara:strand:+ start:45 stop:194 length:150 start_codon:yes stop_codon:yes gene_type:complete